MCDTSIETGDTERRRGRPRKSPEDKISNAEAQRRYRSDPVKKERARLCSKASREKRNRRIKAMELYMKENGIVLPIDSN
jgi:hypothetical protein